MKSSNKDPKHSNFDESRIEPELSGDQNEGSSMDEENQEESESDNDQDDYEHGSFVTSDEEEPQDADLKLNNDEDIKDMTLDDDDYELIGENENGKKKRLHKITYSSKKELVNEDYGFIESEESNPMQGHTNALGQNQIQSEKAVDLIKIFQPDVDDFDNDSKRSYNENQAEVEKIKQLLIDENKFNDEENDLIKSTDIPERYQLRNRKRNSRGECTEQELLTEAKWIQGQFHREFSNQISLNQISKKILKLLEFIRINHSEIMYIYFYKKNEFMPEFSLVHLWKIYDLEEEWSFFYRQHMRIKYQTEQLLKRIIISKQITENMENTTELQTLNYFKDFVDYQASKNNLMKMEKIENDISTIKKRETQFQDLMMSITITPDQLFENLVSERGQKHFPANVQFEIKEHLSGLGDPDSYSFKTGQDILDYMKQFMVNELYYHPLIRKWIRDRYFSTICISTTPINNAEQEIDVFHPFYLVKRISMRKLRDFYEDDLWMLVEQAEKLKKIQVKFSFYSAGEKDDNERDEIQRKLRDNYLSSMNDNIYALQNTIREKIISFLLRSKLYPQLKKEARKDLRDKAEKFIIKQITVKFKELLMTGPCALQNIKSKTPSVLSMVIDKEQSICLVFLDSSGQIEYETMLKNYAKTVLSASNFPNNPRNTTTIREMPTDNEEQILESLLEKFKPELIVVSANCVNARRLRSQMMQYIRKHVQWVTFGDPTVPQVFSRIDRNFDNLRSKPQIVKEAICLGRMRQNCMAAVLSMWNEQPSENGCLYIPFHRFQQYVSSEKLQYEFEKVAVEVVNLVGVDIQEISQNGHLKCQLQFIAGLGLRKAEKLLDHITTNGPFWGRKDLFSIFEKNIVMNCCGFIKINKTSETSYDKGYNDLDATRIHMEYYVLAKKIAGDALDEEFEPTAADKEKVILKIQANPKKLQDLDLEEYAQHLASTKSKENMIYMLNFLVAELSTPFQDPRPAEKNMTDADLFYKLSNENPLTFKQHSIVTARVEKILSKRVILKILDNNLRAFIQKQDFDYALEEEKKSTQQGKQDLKKAVFNQFFKEGSIIKARVKKIEALGEPEKKRNEADKHGKESEDKRRDSASANSNLQDILKVELTLQKVDFKHGFGHYISNVNWKKWKDSFKIKATDFPNQSFLSQNSGVANSQQQVRKINHPKYKHMHLNQVMEYIKNLQNGDFVIRPSSSGPEFLGITWKLYENCVVHLSVREQKTPQQQVVWIMNGEQYESFEQIIENYIQPCNTLVESVISHKKFVKGNFEQIEQKLKKEKESQPTIIHYYFGCFPAYPQYVVLMYIPHDFDVQKEFIKIKDKGLFFHFHNFHDLKELIQYFKQNYKSEEYKKHLKKIRPPIVDNSAQHFLDLNDKKIKVKEERTKAEFGVKTEGTKFSGYICTNCNRKGHSANECTQPVKKQYDRYRQSEDRRSRGDSEHRYAPKDRVCYTCKSADHISKDCPNRSAICYNCNQEGHFQKDCPKGRDFRYNKSSNYRGDRRSRSRSQEKSKRKRTNDHGDWQSNREPANEWNNNNREKAATNDWPILTKHEPKHNEQGANIWGGQW